jgi:hypothetical protein
MSLQILDPQSQQTLSRLKQDVESPSYRTLLLKNPSSGTLDNLAVKVVETGLGAGDAKELANRSIVQLDFTRQSSGLAEQQFIGVDPVSVMVEDEAELEAIQLDGWLQLSADTFRWASKLLLPELAANESIQLYVRYIRPVYVKPNVFRFSLRNIGTDTPLNVVLTRQGSDTLSLDGQTYSNSVNLGDIAPSVVKTIYLKSNAIDPAILGPARIEIWQASSRVSTLPFDAIGFGRAYASIDEVRRYITTIDVDIISQDEEIRDFIYKSANEIDRATRRRFDLVTATERYDGIGQQKLVLDNYPIVSIQEVKIRNPDNQVVTDIKSTDANFASELIIDAQNGFITLPSAGIPMLASQLGAMGWYPPIYAYQPFPAAGVPFDYTTHFGRGISNIEVTYTYGFQVPPEGIRDACKKMVVIELLKKKGASDSQGVATVAVGGMSETFATRGGASGGSGPFGHMVDELQQDIEATLELFRKRRWGVV